MLNGEQGVVAILFNLPAVIFLLIVFALVYRRGKERAVLLGLVGLLLTFLAAGIQQARIGLPLLHLDYNALFHLIQAVALFLLYRSACWFVDQSTWL